MCHFSPSFFSSPCFLYFTSLSRVALVCRKNKSYSKMYVNRNSKLFLNQTLSGCRIFVCLKASLTAVASSPAHKGRCHWARGITFRNTHRYKGKTHPCFSWRSRDWTLTALLTPSLPPKRFSVTPPGCPTA